MGGEGWGDPNHGAYPGKKCNRAAGQLSVSGYPGNNWYPGKHPSFYPGNYEYPGAGQKKVSGHPGKKRYPGNRAKKSIRANSSYPGKNIYPGRIPFEGDPCKP